MQIHINRAPVLTLWTTIVAERLGYSEEEALTFGRAVASLNAQSKGKKLGIFEPDEVTGKVKEDDRKKPQQESVKILHRSIPVENTKQGARAVLEGKPIRPESVRRYLEEKFGDDLDEVRNVMEALAESYGPEQLERIAYRL